MKYFGAKHEGAYGFYLEPFEGAVEVEDEIWVGLMRQCSEGKVLEPDENGYPVAVEYERSDEELAIEARSKRDELLARSDWTQLQDAALNEEERQNWQIYRQALRDVPQQVTFPRQVTWPSM